jgi:hypothetical protein
VNDKDKLRIGDSDRELVSRLLKSAVDEGRLSLAEYDDRLQQVYEAKTVGDLDPITGDLMGAGRGVLAVTESGDLAPRVERPQGSPPPQRRRRPRHDRTPDWIKWMWFGGVVPMVICTVIWVISQVAGSGDPDFWPIWVIGTVAAPMLCVTGMERFLIRPSLQQRDGNRAPGTE